MDSQPLHRVVREFIAALVATGGPSTLDKPFSAAGIRLSLARQKFRGNDEILAQFAIRAPATVNHYIWSSSIVSADLSDHDREILRSEIETVIFRYLNPLDQIRGAARTLWLLSETEQSQLSRVMALAPEDEADYVFMAGANAQWTGPIRGLHKSMATLAQLLSRHPDFAIGKVSIRPPTTLLYFGDAHGLDKVLSVGIGVDGRTVPTRGLFAVDSWSYMDALMQLGEDDARDLLAVEFRFSGSCGRAQSPLATPLYRIPHAISPESIVSVTKVNGNKVTYQAPHSE